MRRLWSDEEIGYLLDNPDMIAREVAEELGRSRQSVQHMRDKLRSEEWSPSLDGWTVRDDEYLRATTHLTAAEVAEALGRSYDSVTGRRRILSRDEGVRFGNSMKNNPHAVGKRRLLAKTCPDCGQLLEARWFGFYGKGWRTKCQHCCPTQPFREKSDEARQRTVDSGRDFIRRMQEFTRPHAHNNGNDWVEADHTVLSDPDLLIVEKALRLGRTYMSVASMCSKSGYASKVGRLDPSKGQWVIDNPSELAVAS